jgi:hypothetical protein
VSAQTTHALMSVQKQSQRTSLHIGDEIKVDGVGYYVGNGETFVGYMMTQVEGTKQFYTRVIRRMKSILTLL